MRPSALAVAVVLAVASTAHSEQKHDIRGFGLGMTAEEIARVAPEDCWDQEVYYFCNDGSFMVLYASTGAVWTVTFSWQYSGPLDLIAQRLSAEYQVDLARNVSLESFTGTVGDIRIKLLRNGSDTRITITDMMLADGSSLPPTTDHHTHSR